MTDTAVRPGQTASAHPLDPVTAAEYPPPSPHCSAG